MRFIIISILIFLTFVIFGIIGTNTIKSTSTFDYDCKDFYTQEQAQEVFNRNSEDIYDLDRNKDGIACSSLK